ncbi:hypothetical protein MSAN_02256200 [Mycena sanguinolenta]|uniref:Uncharacterized protein n=1 Tax=Mycena sanguinolenta TaxID=230812 RepID=A0A8H6XB70_9AGAR|nr:hypothetical protein MSAN_02256200 [Mycena sanguinolenta]
MPLVCQNCGQSLTAPVPEASASPYHDVFSAPSYRTALAEVQVEIAQFKAYSKRYISALVKQQEEVEARLKAIVRDQTLEQLDILPILHRLRRLDLPPAERICQGLIPFHISLPQLQCLHTPFSAVELQRVFHDAPLLAELHWTRDSPETLDFSSLTSNALTEFCIFSDYAFSSAEFIAILQNLPSLSELACTVTPEANHHHSPLTFPNLSTLCLFRDYDSDISALHTLKLLTLPNLVSLECFSSLNPDVTLPFLSRSGCVIRKLTCDFYEDIANISRNLEIFSSVEKLYIHVVDIADCLRAIGPQCNEAFPPSLILPKLRHVTITCQRHMVSADYSSVVDLIHGRRAHPNTAELKSLEIVVENFTEGNLHACPNCPSDAVAAELRSLAVGGLDLKVDAVFPPKTEVEDE